MKTLKNQISPVTQNQQGISVLLLAHDPNCQEIYQNAINEIAPNTNISLVTNLFDLLQALKIKAYNGLMLDTISKAKGIPQEKELLNQIIESFPTLLLRWNPTKQKIFSMYYGNEHDCDSITQFITQQCKNSIPHKIRQHARVNIQLNLLLSPTPFDSKIAQKTVTVDISKTGFYIYSIQKWKVGQLLSCTIKEFTDQTPITTQVQWSLPWGQNNKFPGIGVTITNITPSQQTQLNQWLPAE